MKASLNDYRQSPRKVRLVASAMRGKSVPVALASISFIDKKASAVVKKLIESAVANAKSAHGMDSANLIIKEIRVDAGTVLKRMMPRARGSSAPIKKRTSHIMLVLGEKPNRSESAIHAAGAPAAKASNSKKK